jgi:hypothetical protein
MSDPTNIALRAKTRFTGRSGHGPALDYGRWCDGTVQVACVLTGSDPILITRLFGKAFPRHFSPMTDDETIALRVTVIGGQRPSAAPTIHCDLAPNVYPAHHCRTNCERVVMTSQRQARASELCRLQSLRNSSPVLTARSSH